MALALVGLSRVVPGASVQPQGVNSGQCAIQRLAAAQLPSSPVVGG